MALIVVTGHIELWSENVDMKLSKANVEFLWWGGVVCTVIFESNPTTVLRLFCVVVVVGVVTIFKILLFH